MVDTWYKQIQTSINGNLRILKWSYVSTIFLAICCGDIPWNLGQTYLQSIGSCCMAVDSKHFTWEPTDCMAWDARYKLLGGTSQCRLCIELHPARGRPHTKYPRNTHEDWKLFRVFIRGRKGGLVLGRDYISICFSADDKILERVLFSGKGLSDSVFYGVMQWVHDCSYVNVTSRCHWNEGYSTFW